MRHAIASPTSKHALCLLERARFPKDFYYDSSYIASFGIEIVDCPNCAEALKKPKTLNSPRPAAQGPAPAPVAPTIPANVPADPRLETMLQCVFRLERTMIWLRSTLESYLKGRAS